MKRISIYSLAIALLLTFIFSSCTKEVAPPEPYGAIPTEHQLGWQQMEYYMFVHFGPNTFTDVEWGDGKEDPKVFNPSNVDCRQWAATAKAAGMKAIILTVKHHDGFCLWPSKYSTHTVRESLWKDGKGDILKELAEACREYGLKLGVYLSPWDQNHPDYGTAAYNQIFANTLTEVLTGYGDVFEQWFDGANGGYGHAGKSQVYDWDMFHKVVYDNQPHAIIFSDIGPGCRWMGNERGIAGETNWSRLNIDGFEPGAKAPVGDTLNIGNVKGKYWIPAETDVSIRPGWFYSPSTDDKVKSVDHLMDIYYTSIGRNSNLLLNVPPDRSGRIHTADSTRLMEFRKAVEVAFENNLAKGADVKIQASATRGNAAQYDASNLIDGKSDTYWATDDNVLTASIELDFGKIESFNRILLQEYIPLGQRVASFNVECWDNEKSEWKALVGATTIGYKRILRFPMTVTQKIKINIVNSLACPVLNNIEIYKAPEQLTAPTIERSKEGLISLLCATDDPEIYYTTDGTEPTMASPKYTSPFAFAKGGIVKAVSVIDNGNRKSDVVAVSFDIAPAKWSVISPSDADKAIDGSVKTYASIKISEPLVIDMGEQLSLTGFSYIPRSSTQAVNIMKCNVTVSDDGKTWKLVKSNVNFLNIKNNPVKQVIDFGSNSVVAARYLKVEPLEFTNKGETYVVAEIEVSTAK